MTVQITVADKLIPDGLHGELAVSCDPWASFVAMSPVAHTGGTATVSSLDTTGTTR